MKTRTSQNLREQSPGGKNGGDKGQRDDEAVSRGGEVAASGQSE